MITMMNNIIHSGNYNSAAHAFFFDAKPEPPVVIAIKILRSETEYDSDSNAEETSMKRLLGFSKCFAGNIFLIVSSQHIAPKTVFRSKKGVFSPQSRFRLLKPCNFEIDAANDSSRLGAVVSLENFDYDWGHETLLNFGYSLLILTQRDFCSIQVAASNWLNINPHCGNGFDHSNIMKYLLKDNETAILRYFPADNAKPENLVAIGNESFLSRNILNCFDQR